MRNKQTNLKSNKSMKALAAAALAVVMILGSGFAYAEQASATMGVTATVKSSCKVKTNNVKFATYDPAGVNASQDLNAQGSIDVKCTKGTVAKISISKGNNAGQAGGSRAMVSADGDSYLAYELYQDASGQKAWDGQSTVEYVSKSAETNNLKVYAKVPANQQVADGSYSDLLVVTINY